MREHVKCCRRCVFSKAPEPEARAPLENIITTEPLELVCIDFWSAEDSAKHSVDVLVVTDHFTKMAHAFLCANQSAKSVAHQLWNNYFCVYGFPQRIHSDQGGNFESALIAELLSVAGVAKLHTTPYHPMVNGSCERFNRTLGNIIRALPPKAKHKLPLARKSLTFADNCTTHETTGFAPFLLMFGRTPRLPVDVIFATVLHDPYAIAYDQYVQSFRSVLIEAMTTAQMVATKQLKRHTNLYNKRVRGAPMEVVDRVLLVNKGERGRRKLADRSENSVYLVVEINVDSHTFRIQNSSTGQVKTVHHNLIIPVNFVPLPDDSDNETGMSDMIDCEDLNGGSMTSATVGDSVDAAEYGTRLWVSELTADAVDQLRFGDGEESMENHEVPSLAVPSTVSLLMTAPLTFPDPDIDMTVYTANAYSGHLYADSPCFVDKEGAQTM